MKLLKIKRKCDRGKNITPIIGLVEETLPLYLKDKIFNFAWVDMDLYQPTSIAYKFLEERLSIGGIIGFHDYKFPRCPGIEKVVDEEMNKDRFQFILNEWTCIFFRKVK